MKYVYYNISLLVLLCSATCRAQDTSLLMVHFGTTYDATRQKTIDAINQKARAAFPQYDFAEAYTSRIVMKRLAELHPGISGNDPYYHRYLTQDAREPRFKINLSDPGVK